MFTNVNMKLIDGPSSRRDHKQMVDKTPFQLRFDHMLSHVNAANRAAFADQIGVSRQVINNWYNRDQRIGGRNRGIVQAATGVSVDWVNEGIGPVLIENRDGSGSSGETRDGYVRIDLIDGVGDMGDGYENSEFPEVIRQMEFAESQVRNLLGFAPKHGRLKLMTGRGISMEPLIRSGDVVIVDTECNRFDGDGIYVINSGNGQQIKALQDRGSQIYVVSANTDVFPAFPLPTGTVIGGKVYVRNRLDRLD